MPIAAIGIGLGTAIGGAATAGAMVYGAHRQSRAAQQAANTQVQGANYAADKQDEASRRTEQFQRESAQQAWAQQEADRRANYDQWVSRERRLGSIAERLGYGGREIPGYVPSVNPGYVPSQAGGPPSTSMPVNGGPGTPLTPGAYHRDPRLEGNYSSRPAVATSAPPQQQPMSVRDVMMARRFPQGSVGAMVMARQQRPAGVGV